MVTFVPPTAAWVGGAPILLYFRRASAHAVSLERGQTRSDLILLDLAFAHEGVLQEGSAFDRHDQHESHGRCALRVEERLMGVDQSGKHQIGQPQKDEEVAPEELCGGGGERGSSNHPATPRSASMGSIQGAESQRLC